MNEILENNLKAKNTWMRLLYMVFLGVIFGFAKLVLFVSILGQFIFVLITSDKNKNLLSFSKDLCTYLFNIMVFLTYNTERKPFPFASWNELEAEPAAAPVSAPQPPRAPSDENLEPIEEVSTATSEQKGSDEGSKQEETLAKKTSKKKKAAKKKVVKKDSGSDHDAGEGSEGAA